MLSYATQGFGRATERPRSRNGAPLVGFPGKQPTIGGVPTTRPACGSTANRITASSNRWAERAPFVVRWADSPQAEGIRCHLFCTLCGLLSLFCRS